MLSFLKLLVLCRLGSKPLLASIGRLPTMLGSAQYAQGAMGVPKVTFKKYEPLKDEHFEVRNERLKRPLSPYLYSVVNYPKLTSTLSITHRITGKTNFYSIFFIVLVCLSCLIRIKTGYSDLVTNSNVYK